MLDRLANPLRPCIKLKHARGIAYALIFGTPPELIVEIYGAERIEAARALLVKTHRPGQFEKPSAVPGLAGMMPPAEQLRAIDASIQARRAIDAVMLKKNC